MNVDQYGHCVICHKNLLVERTVDNRVIHMFSPEHDETEFMLDDGSRMRVCICKSCKSTQDMSDIKVQSDIMGAVIEGWKIQSAELVSNGKWTSEQAQNYIDVYEDKNILCHSENLAPHVIEQKRQDIISKTQHIVNFKDILPTESPVELSQ